MNATLTSLVTAGAAVGCGLIAGVFWAFSNFVMPALARLPPREGVAAMQSINRVVLNRRFLGVLFGTALCCLALALTALWGNAGAGAELRLVGAALYLLGTILVTKICHVPRNEALARHTGDPVDLARTWSRYVAGWTVWNHVRAAAAFAAAISLTLALLTSSGCDTAMRVRP